MKKMTKVQRDEKYSYYLDESKKLEDWFTKLSLNLDKLIFGLATGTLILSINFIDKIIHISSLKNIILLKISWISLVIILIFNIISHIAGIKEVKKRQNLLDKWGKNSNPKSPDLINIYTKITNFFSVSSILLLIISISVLGYFTIININQIIMNDEKKLANEEEQVEKMAEPAFYNKLTPDEIGTEETEEEKEEEKE